ncbi:MAG: nucleotidyltransferase domain-containing protein [Clostridia bacterium]|jgi:predicted nucleotidyltransferase|nr:nucleotidyltransferase domain-containing protein [Clostridia bacterium]
MDKEIINLANKIVDKVKPQKIILFGSKAKGLSRENSDIDICVIVEFENKHKKLMEIYEIIDLDIDVDIVLYSPNKWEELKDDSSTFAGIINETGKVLYG